ncbi:hypothetical protein FQA39_LY02252 [Lamprigera yunnana]|nr:hypothetical protein FQA39_LY02252 [Lamprigera yunnana]
MYFQFIVILSLFAIPSIHGKAAFINKIVGGLPAPISSFSYQLSVLYKGAHLCGASLIRSNTVLTAAHCIRVQRETKLPAKDLQVSGGSSFYSNGTKISVQATEVHLNYNFITLENDIAIIKLKIGFTLSKNVNTVPLPLLNSEVSAGTAANVSGWGQLSEIGESPLELQYVQVFVIDRRQCTNMYRRMGDIGESMLCASARDKDSCYGDSGGPLTTEKVQIGIVSWGYGCALANYPGVYTQVSKYVEWIKLSLLIE